jgi:hypothetical protein
MGLSAAAMLFSFSCNGKRSMKARPVLEIVAAKLLGYVVALLPTSMLLPIYVLSTLCCSCIRLPHLHSSHTVAGCELAADFDGCSLSSVTFASLQGWQCGLHLALTSQEVV